MKQRNYKLQIVKDIVMALCLCVIDIYYWCQISKDKAIWILAVGFAIFTVARILDVKHDIDESKVFDENGKEHSSQNRLSLILDFCGCAVLVASFIILCCGLFGNL